MLGDAGVGKSCIVHRLISNQFSEHSATTVPPPRHRPAPARQVGANHHTHLVRIIGGTALEFRIWDTAGQERFRSFVPMYFRDAAAAVIVFDLSDRASFESAKGWVKMVNDEAGESVVATALAGSKCDLPHSVSADECEQLAKSNGWLYMEVSAKTGLNVNELYAMVAEKVISERKARQIDEAQQRPAVELSRKSSATQSKRCSC